MNRLKDFADESGQGIYMPKNGPAKPFSYNDGDAAEEYFLRCIQQASDVSDNSSELLSHAKDWSSYYHLAPGRANHIRALALPRDISILELGAGCGAISRYLGENHSIVHSVEGSPRRAKIARERCRGLDNVKVYCADFSALEVESEYDLVLLNGVLEYAPVFLGGNGRSPDQATAALLQLAKSALKQDGVLLVAIENKIGLKYWCGAEEDHTGGLFDGIHGYPTPGTARTYSKKELEKILEGSGFVQHRFYACFPDYKFTTSILADSPESLDNAFLHNWTPYPANNPGLNRQYLIHEGLAAKTLNDAGLIHEFANSFLVVASVDSPNQFSSGLNPKWLAAKVSVTNRDKSVHCITKFYPKNASVEKTLIHYGSALSGTIKPLEHDPQVAQWIAGNLLSWEAANAVMSKNFLNEVPVILAEYHAELLKKFSTGAVDGEGFPVVDGEAFDFIMANIIRTPTGLEGIDAEWKLSRLLSADYVLYRSLCYDVIGLNKHWIGHKIADLDAFSISMIRTIYPDYNRQRHEKNRALETEILLEIRGNLGISTWNQAAHGPAWKRAIKAVGKRLPAHIRKAIIRFSGDIYEKIQIVFSSD